MSRRTALAESLVKIATKEDLGVGVSSGANQPSVSATERALYVCAVAQLPLPFLNDAVDQRATVLLGHGFSVSSGSFTYGPSYVAGVRVEPTNSRVRVDPRNIPDERSRVSAAVGGLLHLIDARGFSTEPQFRAAWASDFSALPAYWSSNPYELDAELQKSIPLVRPNANSVAAGIARARAWESTLISVLFGTSLHPTEKFSLEHAPALKAYWAQHLPLFGAKAPPLAPVVAEPAPRSDLGQQDSKEAWSKVVSRVLTGLENRDDIRVNRVTDPCPSTAQHPSTDDVLCILAYFANDTPLVASLSRSTRGLTIDVSPEVNAGDDIGGLAKFTELVAQLLGCTGLRVSAGAPTVVFAWERSGRGASYFEANGYKYTVDRAAFSGSWFRALTPS